MAQTELQRAANPVPRLLEKQIQQTCCEFLEWDGWRRIRMEAISEASFIERAMAKMLKHPTLSLFLPLIRTVLESSRRAAGVGEIGMADDLFIRYQHPDCRSPKCNGRGLTQVLWVEWKREVPPTRKRPSWPRSTKASIHQEDWHALERSRGALTLIAGEDFPATIEGFRAFYWACGLARKPR